MASASALGWSGSGVVVYVTAPSEEAGLKLARGLVSAKLAACVNVAPRVTSVYEWEGKVEEEAESLLIIKSTTDALPKLTDWVKTNHPYDVPEVISLPVNRPIQIPFPRFSLSFFQITGGSETYLKWLVDAVKP